MSMYDRIQDGPYTDKGLSAGASLGMAGGKIGAQIEQQPTAFADASTAMCDARTLASRVSALVDRFCGSVPTSDGPDGRCGIENTILGDLRSDAERTVEAIRFAHDRLNRLERELP